MKRPMTEQMVLKKLDIPDFRHLTKDKVIAFASMLPKMDPEVAKKALEQFPNFASTSLDIMKEYKDSMMIALEAGGDSAKQSFAMYDRVMSSLERMLEEDDLTFDEKTYILEQMKEVALHVDQKDSENKNAILKGLAMAGTVAMGVMVTLGAVLGSTTGIKSIGDE